MKVEELIIDGFKSYATRTVISGWDPQFNAITGLNGSGKSNILDAICFVLGIASMSTVRASNLQDLIYKRGQAGVTKASVTIVFDNSEVSKSPIGFENCPKISVTRQIILGGSSKYLVNGHKAQQQTVLNLFQSVQLNINNPNFLIMQGKITKVLNMKPTETLSLIEEAAGTRTFEERKDKAQKTMAKKESKLAEIRSLLQEEIEPKLEKLRNEKRTFLEFQQIHTDLEKMSRIIAAHDYALYSKKFDEHSTMLNERETIMTNLNRDVEKLETEIKNLTDDLKQVKKQRDLELKKDGKIRELEALENQYSDEITRLNTSKDIIAENIKSETKKLTKLEQQIFQLHQALENNADIYSNHEKQYKNAKDALAELKNEFNRKEELLSTLSTGVSSKGDTDGGYLAQLKEVKEKLNDSNVFVQQSKLKIAHLTKQISNDKSKLASAKQSNESVLKDIESYKHEINHKESKLAEFGYDSKRVSELRQQESVLSDKVSKLNNELNYLRREVGNVEFNYTKPNPNFDSNIVRGIAAQLFTLDDSNADKAMALQVCAGGRLYNVIVDTSDAASQLLEKGELKKRVTIIPLDKISSRVMDDRAVKAAKTLCPNKVELALHLVDFENELLKAMQYIFGNTFICNDPQTAKMVTFDPQIRARSITLEGDIYDPEGNLSGGSRKNNSSILIAMQKYNRLQNQIKTYQNELFNVQRDLQEFEKLSPKTQSLQNEINLSKHELTLLMRKFENNSSSLILRENVKNEQEIKALNEQIIEEEAKSKAYSNEINSIEKDMKEFSSDKGSKLKKLEREVSSLRDKVLNKEEEIREKSDEFQSMQIESEQQQGELTNLKESFEYSQNLINESNQELKNTQESITEKNENLEHVKIELEEEKANLLGLNEEMNELTSILQAKNESLNNSKLSIQKLNHELEKSSSITNNLKNHLDALVQEHDWVMDSNILDSIIQKYPNINLDECHEQEEVLKEKFQGMKRKVNTNIMNMIDNVEKKESSLKQMIRTIEKDKSKIENTIDKLNGYKRDTLNTTYQKVSVDFGNIFADLLPGSFAKLVPVDAEDVTKGLGVKVKLGPVWKESLVELSGGQRSLIALSLIMALLQFKPAPMYILDEVDAALDLSHTQNIGHLIKTRFKGSQFIIVSLKEGMFTNANRVFRTRFQDGTSIVSVIRLYATLKALPKARHSILSIRDELKKKDNLDKARLNSGEKIPKNNIDATDATRSILQNKKASYFDPANSSLNLALDNTTLFNKISKDAEIRMNKRFKEASNSWLNGYKKLTRSIPQNLVKAKTKTKGYNKDLLIQTELENHLKNATISPESASNAISAGDLVALNNDSVSLYIIVSCPTDLDSNSYTFINREGEIVYGPKQLIKLRFPGVVPSHLLGIIKDFVQLETKYLDMAPVGVTDATFSKSEQSKPKEIRKAPSKPQNLSANDGNKGHVDSSEIGGDFIVAQASSQLLTNSDVNTYHIPIRAREIYSKALTQISIKTFEKIPEISQKLEILHRVLQYDEDGDCLDSPRTISIFLLLHYVELFSLNMIPKLIREGSDTQGEADLFKTLRKKLSDSFSDFDNEIKYSNLGKMVPKDVSWMQFANEAYPVSTFMSLILALRTQGRLWNINQQNSTNPPLSVNILPLRNVDLLEKTISFLKFKSGDVKFADYLIKKLKKEKVDVPEYYNEVVQLFKDYTAGNFTNDPAAETALVSVIRLVDKSLKEEDLYPERYTSLTYDYSRARGFELLQMLEDPLNPSSCGWENPANWSYALQLPNNNVLLMSDLSADYYQYLDDLFSSKEHQLRELVEEGNSIKHAKSNTIPSLEGFDVAFSPKDNEIELTDDFYTSDPLTEIREDFGNTPIYCIDSETAHEIDDGISINTSKDGMKYIISVHVANPTSYVKPFSTISNIAFSKGSTTYLPEGPSMMLPNIISKIAGLGETPRTRTFVIQYTLDKSLVDSYIKQKNNDQFFKPDLEFSNRVLKDIESSVDIKLCMAHNFPKSFTYSKVNEILNNENEFESFKKGTVTDVHSSNLFKLYNISTILKDIRIMVGDGLEMSIPRSSVTVDYTTGKFDQRFEESENGYELTVQDHSSANRLAVVSILNGADQGVLSKSQLLVSHFMISANYAASIFATKNNIPIIHRNQQMKLEDSILNKLREISKRKYLTNEDLSIEDVSKVLSVLTSAKFLVEKKPHESLGLQGYATVTSPLRRFVDMINHWKIEEYLLSRADIPTSNIQDTQLYYMGNHLQTCELINKKMQSFSNKFWEGIFLKEYLRLLNEGKISKPVTFKLLLKSNPKFGNISVHVLGFNNLKATLESTQDVIEKFNTGEFRVGQVLVGNFQITKLDYIEDELVFRYK